MAVLTGKYLRGKLGATVATIGICLPGAIFMITAAAVYKSHGDIPWVESSLRGVAAAAVGLVLATSVQLGHKSLKRAHDFTFVALAIMSIHVFHFSVPLTVALVGAVAIWAYRPAAVKVQPVPATAEGDKETQA